MAELARQIAGINREAAEKEAEVAELQAQKERQSGRKIKEMADAADSLSKKCAPPSSWSLRPMQEKNLLLSTVFSSNIYRACAALKRLFLFVSRLVQLTTTRKNAGENLEAERAMCDQHRASISELAEEKLAAKALPCFSALPWGPYLNMTEGNLRSHCQEQSTKQATYHHEHSTSERCLNTAVAGADGCSDRSARRGGGGGRCSRDSRGGSTARAGRRGGGRWARRVESQRAGTPGRRADRPGNPHSPHNKSPLAVERPCHITISTPTVGCCSTDRLRPL